MASRRRAALPAGAIDPAGAVDPAAVDPAATPATRGPWRVLRGLVVAAVVLGLSLAGHVLAGGAAPWQAVAVLAVATVAVFVALSGRQWGLGRLVVLLGAAQLALHLALTWASERMTAPAGMAAGALRADPMTAGPAGVSASPVGMTADSVGMTADPMAGGGMAADAMAGMDPRAMLLGHAAALLLAAVFLRFGETRLWRLLAVILAPWHRDLRLAPSRPTRVAAVPLPVPVPRVRTRLFADVLPRRGPPVPVA